MYFNALVHYLYFDALPYQYMVFFGASVKEHTGAFMFYQCNDNKGNKVCGASCKFTGHIVGGASRALRTHCTIFFYFFLHLKFHSILNFDTVQTY
jgi:hypothetical protein